MIRAGKEVAVRELDRLLGLTMHKQVIEAGDLHADLWESLTIFQRHIEGPEDVAVGEHPDLGLCVVSHYALENEIEWWTQQPIRKNGSSACCKTDDERAAN